MNRYFFYLFLFVALMNIMLFVPHILVDNRFEGSVAAILISPIFGSIMIYMFTNAMARFPGQGLPEIFAQFFPRWFVSVYMFFYAMMYWFSSTVVAMAFAVLINRFFNPHANVLIIMVVMVLASGYAATRSTLTVMLLLEIIIIINVPIILFIMFKMVTSPQLNLDSIHVVANYIGHWPNLASIAAATYIFTGYINLSLFNRLFPPNFRFKLLWTYPILGLLILLVTFFVPIGFHGTQGISQYIYLWTITADSLMMQYGFIERVMFLFLIVFLNLSLVYTATAWHQAMEFIKGCMPSMKPETDSPKAPITNYVIIGLFTAASVLYMVFTNEKMNLAITTVWLILRMFTEVMTVVTVFILSRRRLVPR
ncbi:GerAB/ArcD/ProY family transporter [Paenibacillus sp. CAU 1782]